METNLPQVYSDMMVLMKRINAKGALEQYKSEIVFLAGQIFGAYGATYEDQGLASAVFSSFRFSSLVITVDPGLIQAVESRLTSLRG